MGGMGIGRQGGHGGGQGIGGNGDREAKWTWKIWGWGRRGSMRVGRTALKPLSWHGPAVMLGDAGPRDAAPCAQR